MKGDICLQPVERFGVRWAGHPLFVVPNEDEVAALAGEIGKKEAAQLVIDWWKQREPAIEREELDPYRYCYRPKAWKDADKLLEDGHELLVLGGNRSGKSFYAAWKTIQALKNQQARAWAFQATEKQSIDEQQPYVWKMMGAGMQAHKSMRYTARNGFSEGLLVLPGFNSRLRFRNYGQAEGSLESAELDWCWCDELCPQPILETLRYRLVTRGGRLLLTFTPIIGYTPTVAEYLDGAEIIEQMPVSERIFDTRAHLVPRCKPGHVPYILRCFNPDRHVICFPTEANPYNDWDRMVATVSGKPVGERLTRAYGWPTKRIANAFPRYGDVNLVRAKDIPQEGTNYMVVDPGGSKNWFMIWLRVTPEGWIYVYREWPDQSFGEWALPGEKPDGKAGPAQHAMLPRGCPAINELILNLEGGEMIAERIIDPRSGPSNYYTEAQSLIDTLADGEHGLVFNPAPATTIQDGINLLSTWMEWDSTAPVSDDNSPRLYVSDQCRNLDFCLRIWTGLDGLKGASKDPVDCLMYAAKANIAYGEVAQIQGPRGW